MGSVLVSLVSLDLNTYRIRYGFVLPCIVLVIVNGVYSDSDLAIIGPFVLILLTCMYKLLRSLMRHTFILSFIVVSCALVSTVVIAMGLIDMYVIDTRRAETFAKFFESFQIHHLLLPVLNDAFMSEYSFHNEYIEVFRTLGILGLVGWVYWLCSEFRLVTIPQLLGLLVWVGFISALVVTPLTNAYVGPVMALLLSLSKSLSKFNDAYQKAPCQRERMPHQLPRIT